MKKLYKIGLFLLILSGLTSTSFALEVGSTLVTASTEVAKTWYEKCYERGLSPKHFCDFIAYQFTMGHGVLFETDPLKKAIFQRNLAIEIAVIAIVHTLWTSYKVKSNAQTNLRLYFKKLVKKKENIPDEDYVDKCYNPTFTYFRDTELENLIKAWNSSTKKSKNKKTELIAKCDQTW